MFLAFYILEENFSNHLRLKPLQGAIFLLDRDNILALRQVVTGGRGAA